MINILHWVTKWYQGGWFVDCWSWGFDVLWHGENDLISCSRKRVRLFLYFYLNKCRKSQNFPRIVWKEWALFRPQKRFHISRITFSVISKNFLFTERMRACSIHFHVYVYAQNIYSNAFFGFFFTKINFNWNELIKCQTN